MLTKGLKNFFSKIKAREPLIRNKTKLIVKFLPKMEKKQTLKTLDVVFWKRYVPPLNSACKITLRRNIVETILAQFQFLINKG